MKKFWNFKAKKYPRPFEKKVLRETKNVIKLLNSLGVDLDSKEIIDIGCGTGIYSLIFDQKAKKIFCLDFSSEMLRVLKEEADKNSITNIEILQKDFSRWDIKKYQKCFDISFASMTPAVRSLGDILKMEKLSRKWCVYIGWTGKRENKVMEEVYSLFNLKPYTPNGYFDVKEILEKRNIKYKTHIFETSWEWEGTIDEAVDEFSQRILLDIKKLNRKKIRKYLCEKFKNGIVKTKTVASEGILVWKVN